MTASAAAASNSLPIGLFTVLAPPFVAPTGHDATLILDSTPSDDKTARQLAATNLLAVCLDVERIAQAVSEQVERQRCDHEEDAGEHHQPPGDVVVERRVVQQRSPGRLVRRHAEPDERQPGFEQDVAWYQEGRVHDDRTHQVRQDLLADDPEVACAQGAAGLDELALTQREREAAHDAPHVGPAEEGYDEDHDADAGLDQSAHAAVDAGAAGDHDPDRDDEHGDGEHDVGDAREHGVRPTAEVAR